MNGPAIVVLDPRHTPQQVAAALAALEDAYRFKCLADEIAQALVENLNRNAARGVLTS